MASLDRDLLSEDGCGRATGYGETNKIISSGDMTHVTWLDSDAGGFLVRIRTLDRTTGQWSPTYTLGPAADNHGGPALTIDSEGYLHTLYYPHHGSFRYRKSVNPNDASAWEPETLVGSKCSYPTLMTGPDDTLYLTARESALDPWTVNLYTKPADGYWSRPTNLIRANSGGYSHFQESLAWGPDHQTLHLATRMYGDSPAWGYMVGYMKSTDFGQTWQQYDGTPITLPALKDTLDAVEVIDPAERSVYNNGSSLRGGSIAVDANNVPHILYNTLDDGGTVPRQAWIATPDDAGGWDKLLLNDKCDILPEGWGLGMSGGLVFGDDGRMFITLTMCSDSSLDEIWAGDSSEVIWMESNDGGETFSSTVLSDFDPNTPNWLPNIERPTGFNSIDVPSVIYTSGVKGDTNGDILSNNVFWVQTDSLTSIPGDANRDGQVDGSDVTILAGNWQAGVAVPDPVNIIWTMGDFNGDGQIDGSDVTILAGNWQYGVSAAATAVPEPSTMISFLLGLIALSLGVVRRR